MITTIEATFANGVLTPDTPLDLPEQTRVRLTVEYPEGWTPDASQAAWQAMLARMTQQPIGSGGMRFTRDQLHDRN